MIESGRIPLHSLFLSGAFTSIHKITFERGFAFFRMLLSSEGLWLHKKIIYREPPYVRRTKLSYRNRSDLGGWYLLWPKKELQFNGLFLCPAFQEHPLGKGTASFESTFVRHAPNFPSWKGLFGSTIDINRIIFNVQQNLDYSRAVVNIDRLPSRDHKNKSQLMHACTVHQFKGGADTTRLLWMALSMQILCYNVIKELLETIRCK